jgi:hypothetical protein
MSFYVSQPAGKLRLGIYDATASNGGPGSLIAQSDEIFPVAMGWNTVTLATPVALAVGSYWLAYSPSDSGLGYRVCQDQTGTYLAAPALAYGPMPSPFPTQNITGSGVYHWSFYATVVTSG